MYNKPVAINGKWSILQENKNNDWFHALNIRQQ
jgi:hypothetical protein